MKGAADNTVNAMKSTSTGIRFILCIDSIDCISNSNGHENEERRAYIGKRIRRLCRI
jgi:hypothetical protein